jgi:hypothetical protein
MRLWPEATNEFQRRWNQNWLTVFVPGFLLFGLGAYTNLEPVVIGGWLVVVVWGILAWRLMRKFRRCTGCRRVSYPRLGDDGSCFYCGIELPLNGPD